MECPHKYTKCYKVWVGCYTAPGKKEKVFFRGCGGFATMGEIRKSNSIFLKTRPLAPFMPSLHACLSHCLLVRLHACPLVRLSAFPLACLPY